MVKISISPVLIDSLKAARHILSAGLYLDGEANYRVTSRMAKDDSSSIVQLLYSTEITPILELLKKRNRIQEKIAQTTPYLLESRREYQGTIVCGEEHTSARISQDAEENTIRNLKNGIRKIDEQIGSILENASFSSYLRMAREFMSKGDYASARNFYKLAAVMSGSEHDMKTERIIDREINPLVSLLVEREDYEDAEVHASLGVSNAMSKSADSFGCGSDHGVDLRDEQSARYRRREAESKLSDFDNRIQLLFDLVTVDY